MKKYDVVYGQRYQANGEEKTRWIPCGAVIQTKNGFSLKLDCVPVGVGDSGLWFSLFEPKPRDEAPRPQASQQSAPMADDDLPF